MDNGKGSLCQNEKMMRRGEEERKEEERKSEAEEGRVQEQAGRRGRMGERTCLPEQPWPHGLYQEFCPRLDGTGSV